VTTTTSIWRMSEPYVKSTISIQRNLRFKALQPHESLSQPMNYRKNSMTSDKKFKHSTNGNWIQGQYPNINDKTADVKQNLRKKLNISICEDTRAPKEWPARTHDVCRRLCALQLCGTRSWYDRLTSDVPMARRGGNYRRIVLRVAVTVSEEHAASIFRVEDYSHDGSCTFLQLYI
jgi:hypothetical protein